MKYKQIFNVIIALVITSGIAVALWYWGPAVTGFSVYKVDSKAPNITITQDLLGADIDTTNSSINFSDSFIIESSVNNKALVHLETLKTDVNDSCTDYLNDCNVSYYFGNPYGYGDPFEEIFDGSTIQLKKGENEFTVVGNCLQYSCPQNITSNLSIMLKEND